MQNFALALVRVRWCCIRVLLSMLQQQRMLHSGFLHECDSADFKQLVRKNRHDSDIRTEHLKNAQL